MATKYSDIVKLRESKPAYNIENEEKGEWSSFIANEQFNGILDRVISSVRNNNTDLHKSFWIDGTYGTGKSHAGAVIKHLLCDKLDDIREWVDKEYGDTKFELHRQHIYSLRENKRLFPVMMYGRNAITDKSDLSLQMQKAIKTALAKAGLNLTVQTDFDSYAAHVEANPEIWELVLARDAQLKSVVPDTKKLVKELRAADTKTLSMAEHAMKESGLDVRLDSANLANWFFEVQKKLREEGTYNGLFIVWDEFTDIMRSEFAQTLLIELQKINEMTMNPENDSYFLFISHPSALNSLNVDEQKQTRGRYHYMNYHMEPVSAFKIMSRKFSVVDKNERFNIFSKFFDRIMSLLAEYARYSNNVQETCENALNLFPLHPATANLATYYAREVGSSSRSVFQFIGDNPAVRDFLEDTEHFRNRDTITADYLWDYVLPEFTSNIQKYSMVTERYNSYVLHVGNKGQEYLSVFKGILLLNALNNTAQSPSVTPSTDNIMNLFLGTRIEDSIDKILSWIDSQGVIQKSPAGLYSVQFSALPVKEISDIRDNLKLTEFKFTSQVINSTGTARERFDLYLKGVMRPCEYGLFSTESNNNILEQKIINGRKKTKDYSNFLAILVARNEDELTKLKDFAENASHKDSFKYVVLVVFSKVFGNDKYDRFIEYMANAQCAHKHGFADQEKSHTDNAQKMIEEWINNMKAGIVTLYTMGEASTISTNKLVPTINLVISPRIFSKGAESLEVIRLKSSQTYWKKLSAKEAVKDVLTFNTKEDIISQIKGASLHVSQLLQDSVDDNLEWKADIDFNHPLYQVCEFVDKKIKNTDKSQNFNLAEKLVELSLPPYGLFQTYSGMAMLAFAMRKYANKIFDLNGKPRTAQHLVEDVVEVFKCWESGNLNSNKVIFKFETPEEGKLCKQLIDCFGLKGFKRYADISSLKNARWAITHEFTASKGFPLWSLKYTNQPTITHPDITEPCIIFNEELSKLVDNVYKICTTAGSSNPSLMVSTIELLKKWVFEFKKLINDKDSYKIGFVNFLKRDVDVKLQDVEVEGAIDFIKKRMQSEIGFWEPQKVTEELKNWRISTHYENVSPTPTEVNEQPEMPIDTPEPNESEERIEAVKRATTMLHEMDAAKKDAMLMYFAENYVGLFLKAVENI